MIIIIPSSCNAGDSDSISGLIPASGRSPGEGNGNPLQYSCLENSMDIEAQQTEAHGVTESDTTEQLTLSFFTFLLSKAIISRMHLSSFVWIFIEILIHHIFLLSAPPSCPAPSHISILACSNFPHLPTQPTQNSHCNLVLSSTSSFSLFFPIPKQVSGRHVRCLLSLLHLPYPAEAMAK